MRPSVSLQYSQCGRDIARRQGAVHLASFVRRLLMIVRDQTFAVSMSRYLVGRIRTIPDIALMIEADVVSLSGETCLIWPPGPSLS